MWNKKYIVSICGILFCLIFSACKPQNNIIEGTEKEDLSGISFETFNAKAIASVAKNNQQSLSVGCNIRIKKDSVIIISIQPFAGLEVGKIFFSVDKMALIDRVNKRYFQTDYKNLKKEFETELDYNAIQAIFTNSLFLYGHKKDLKTSDFSIVQMESMKMLQAFFDGINQEFTTDDNFTVQTGTLFKGDNMIRWNYSTFEDINNNMQFPKKVEITASKGSNTIGNMSFDYKKIEINSKINFNFNIPASYKEVTLKELLEMLTK